MEGVGWGPSETQRFVLHRIATAPDSIVFDNRGRLVCSNKVWSHTPAVILRLIMWGLLENINGRLHITKSGYRMIAARLKSGEFARAE